METCNNFSRSDGSTWKVESRLTTSYDEEEADELDNRTRETEEEALSSAVMEPVPFRFQSPACERA